MIWRLVFLFFYSLSQHVWGTELGFDNYLSQAKSHLQQSQFFLALDDFASAQQTAVTAEQQAQTFGYLGTTHYQMRHFDKADGLLRQALDLKIGSPKERAQWAATLAELQSQRGNVQEANSLYTQALTLAANDPRLTLGIQLGQAAFLPEEQRLSRLQDLYKRVVATFNADESARYFLNIGSQAQQLGRNGLQLAYNSFEQARQTVGSQPRLLAESLEGLAQLYENQARFTEAANLNRQALEVAQRIDAHDLLLNLEWRHARLFRQQQQDNEAIVAYQHAVDHIEAIRSDIPVEYHNGRSSFRELLEPVYLGLADLLLTQARQASGDKQQQRLRQARETVERIKQSELEDFMGGRCAVHRSNQALLEAVEPKTAIIYPVMLPDRLEVLVSIGKEIRQFSQPVGSNLVQGVAKQFAHSLRNGQDDIKTLAQQLYQWLIEPSESWLHQQQIETLVMVPDGALRLIPPAALYNGKRYLIEDYALAVSPGLTLIEPTPIQQHGVKALLAGMSEAGSVVEHLPPAFLRAMAGGAESRGFNLTKDNTPVSRALPMNNDEANPVTDQARKIELERDVERLLKEPVFRQQIKEQLSLPGVAIEIGKLTKAMPNTMIMNDGFTVDQFKNQIGKEAYTVVHIASHGVFGKTADTSFIMAYDGVININDLESLLKSEKFTKQPLELLTLSACQTAEGDDRAPLGLSGIALKAKVRSAMGSLWPVSDEAASQLMAAFYKRLSEPSTSKVQALRQAQLLLLKQKDLENPFYWSPFILAGNWL